MTVRAPHLDRPEVVIRIPVHRKSGVTITQQRHMLDAATGRVSPNSGRPGARNAAQPAACR
jgi:hypothetical protein